MVSYSALHHKLQVDYNTWITFSHIYICTVPLFSACIWVFLFFDSLVLPFCPSSIHDGPRSLHLPLSPRIFSNYWLFILVKQMGLFEDSDSRSRVQNKERKKTAEDQAWTSLCNRSREKGGFWRDVTRQGASNPGMESTAESRGVSAF